MSVRNFTPERKKGQNNYLKQGVNEQVETE
jgi:hypothetical protein